MAGKRGRKTKEPEVVEETNSEENTAEEVPAKKRGRATNPKSEEKESKKKTGQTKVEKEESDVDDENEAKEDEDDVESKKSDEVEAKIDDEKDEVISEEGEVKEDEEIVEEKPKRGRGKPKKEAAKPKAKAAPTRKTQRSSKGAPKYTDENVSDDEVEELNNKAEDSDVEFEEEAPKKKRKVTAKKTVQKNGVTTSPSRSSGRNKKVASYAEVDYDDEVEIVKTNKRGRHAGRSKKDDSDSEKVDKEVRVVLEHCKS